MDNAAPPTDRPPSDDGGRGPDQPSQGPRVTRDEVKDLGRLRRSVTDRHVAGVAGGLARHLDVDPIIIRVAFVVAVFFGGAGLLAYAAAWILVPEEGSPDRPLGLDDRSRTLALVGVGVLALLAALGDWAGAFWFPWPVAIVALAVLWFVARGSGSSTGPRYGEGPPAAGEEPAAATGEPSPAAYDEGWAPPPGTPVTYARSPRPPRNPRKRGPILFWFTLALLALAEGVLGVVDVAGAEVIPSAYPALALGITAVMLVLGSFWGRAGGLILVGLVAAVATGLSTAAHSWDEQRLSYAPDTSSEVRGSYELEQGELLLDLSEVGDVEGLDGRDVQVDGGVGRVVVVVPDGVDVSVSANVGVGGVEVFGDRAGGLGISHEGSTDGGVGAPDLRIGIDMGVGDVVVREN
jgi:phage shock protein PspC (stress-responsive transcriptional regulator)